MSAIEDYIERVGHFTGVKGLIICNHDGLPLRDTFGTEAKLLTIRHAALISQVVRQARAAVTQLDAADQLSFLRIRTRNHEILVALDVGTYILIVIQDPTVPPPPQGR
eukprot:TRINITY_DN6778_c0_g1_i1.p2 TRINITY_DN6778_c0_g1~~TRINITY_DN6778_c0_g1_i1.p2  ORF type:complete len:108 (-),score=18.32 TRINITY_DN6778_c0_g1_i1:36-359(-)